MRFGTVLGRGTSGGSISMIHHLGVFASDFESSRAFFAAALQPLGIVAGYEAEGVCEFWHAERDNLHLAKGEVTRGLHLAFEAQDRSAVDAFFRAALGAGGRERHAPRHWPEYRAYCAFVSDPDGNNIEAVHKEA
jgi:catechol 2,3-dioxygenase-like lactoylglutathione lyase family enzyme